jgi:hypothetical protein
MKPLWIYASLLSVCLAGCTHAGHSSARFSSPNGRWILEATADDYGAIASSETVVNLHLSNEGWSSDNNVLIVPGFNTVDAHWEKNDVVRLDCRQCALGDAELITVKKGPIWIQYEGMSP